MPTFRAPVADYQFLFEHVLKRPDIASLNEASELATPLWEEAARLCEQVLFPLNQSGDKEGLKFDNGTVTTPAGFKDAYAQYVGGGWPSFTCATEYGGQGLPEILNMPVIEMICSANLSFGMTPGLSHGAYNAIYKHASDALKEKFLPKMVTGEWAGVMCLTEPHCGTDLGLIRTKAVPTDDGAYAISGTKIFISSGEQDLTDNIIHLVLAKLPDAPEGSSGISLFLVPKVMVNADGSLGERNTVQCTGIEHKMGIHASPTCVMQYDDAVGYLVGQPHKGLKAMFTMMNEARLYVGMQGLGLAEVAYQNALEYAKDRLQGRALKGTKFPEKAADPLTVHADVRRMLLSMKSFCEGARSLALETAMKIDVLHRSEDAAEREEADAWVQLMTPIIKSYFTEEGHTVAQNAMQVFGGHGYIAEYGVEQYARDARIAMIYEGANGIQGLDLIGRKLPYKYGRYLRSFFHPAMQFIEENRSDERMAEFTKPLYQNIKQLQQASLWLAKAGLGDMNNAAAGASEYLRMFALVVMAYQWSRMAKAALALPEEQAALREEKLATARFFMARMLPEATGLLMRLTAGGKTVMNEAVGF